MNRTPLSMAAALAAAALLGTTALAQDQARDQTRDQTQLQIRDDQIYGHQLMTAQERNEYRTRMGAAKTTQERDRLRLEHHERMKARAKERGVTLPDDPPAGRGPGSGMGPGPATGGGGGGGNR